jgi:hypothetical protein
MHTTREDTHFSGAASWNDDDVREFRVKADDLNLHHFQNRCQLPSGGYRRHCEHHFTNYTFEQIVVQTKKEKKTFWVQHVWQAAGRERQIFKSEHIDLIVLSPVTSFNHLTKELEHCLLGAALDDVRESMD